MIKCSIRPKNSSFEERARIQTEHDTILRFIEQPDFDAGFYIFDRFHITEILYGKLKRGYDANENFFYSRLEEQIKKHPHLFVHCTTPIEVHLARYAEKGDDYISEHELKELRLCYEIFFNSFTLNKCTVDLSDDIEKVCLFIIAEYNKQNFGQKTII